MLERLARSCYTRRKLVLLGWLVMLVLVGVLQKTEGGSFATSFTLPGTETQRAVDLLKNRFPARSGSQAEIVFSSPVGVDEPVVRARVEAGLAAVARLPHVVAVTSPWSAAGARQKATDASVAFAEVQLDKQSQSLPTDLPGRIESTFNAAVGKTRGLSVEYGGRLFSVNSRPGGTEAVGLLAAVVILLFTFGSLLAMGLPIAIALVGIFTGLSLIALLENVVEVVQFAPILAAMIGIGVGIDYALFIVTRYRQNLHDGMDPERAVVVAINTAGRAVLFAGCTVVISLLGMFLMGLSVVYGVALGAALAVLATMVASLTLLPALLGFVGHSIDRLHVPGLHRRGRADRPAFWYRWSRQIQARPWPFAIGGFAVLVTLAIPTFSMRLGQTDSGSDPKSTTTRRAYDLMSRGFGPGFNGPLLLAAQFNDASGLTTLNRVADAVRADNGVVAVSPSVLNNPTNPTAAILTVYPRYSPQDARTATLVRHLRREVIGPVVRRSGVVVDVGGTTAAGIDLAQKLSSRLVLFFGAVIFLSFLLLMAVFRSILVPLKAALMNLLSIGAAFGVVVAVFQWGWGGHALGGGGNAPVIAFLPMMMFAILFGLSMDYEVFLLSRVREEYDRTGDNAQAVADGLATTARVITAAAAIMCTVFLAFFFGDNVTVKMFGLGLATAIFVDATVVRTILVPATMELLGDLNWWFPGWLDRVVPRLTVEATPKPSPEGSDEAPEPEPVLTG